jgi:hypothetical protein
LDVDRRDHDSRDRDDFDIYDLRWPYDARTLDDQKRDLEPGCVLRDRDSRDPFEKGLDLPRTFGRELVQDHAENLYELNREDSRMLAIVGAFRVVAERDVEEMRVRQTTPPCR